MLKYTPQVILLGFIAFAMLMILRDHPVIAYLSTFTGFYAAYMSSQYV